jgi:hypothetical protein
MGTRRGALRRGAFGIAFAGALVAPAVGAQDDPLFADRQTEPEARAWSWYGDLTLRRDQVGDLGGREDVDRFRNRLRLGVRGGSDAFEWAVAGKAALGSDANKDNRRNNDNEKSDALTLDEAFLRWLPGEATAVTVGKTALPLELSPLTWDADLRPVGVSAEHSFALGELSRLSVVGGYFAGDHLYGDDSRIGAAQVGFRWHEGAPTSAWALLAYLDFDDLEELTRESLARSNRRVAGRLVSDYRLVDLQLGVRHPGGASPLEWRLDVVRNAGADDLDDGIRGSVVLGTSAVPRGWEFGFAAQRFQRDAVMAAFNEDDWWFHSFARGVMPWVAYGFDETWSIRVAGFLERRDDQAETVDRLLVDVRARW